MTIPPESSDLRPHVATTHSAPTTSRSTSRSRADDALEDGVWMGRAIALARLAGDDLESAVLVRDHRFLGETASRERPERGVLRGRAGHGATLYLTHAPRELARLAAIREHGVRRVVLCEAPPAALVHEAKRAGLALDVTGELDALCA